jgi:CheY-like chemotaxis protein
MAPRPSGACVLAQRTHARTVDRPRSGRQHGAVAPLGSVRPTVRVLVVDDQLVFHDAARAVIDATPGFEWIGGASCGEEGVERAERLRPDLVLMDVRMSGIGGVEASRQIASHGSLAVVVLVSAGPTLSDGSRGSAAEIVPKEGLCGALLRRLWEDYG